MHILNTIILRLILINGHFKDHWVGCFPSTLPSELKKLKTGAKHLKEWLVGELERRTQGNERGYGGYQKERGWNSESKGIQEKIKETSTNPWHFPLLSLYHNCTELYKKNRKSITKT